MKKILAMVLAMMLVLSMSAAFAATPIDTTCGYLTLNKHYVLIGDAAVSPAQNFTFTVAELVDAKGNKIGYYDNSKDESGSPIEISDLPTIETAVYAKGDATVDGNTTGLKELAVTLPEYTRVGVYKYTITESTEATVGVTARAAVINMVVTVTQGTNGLLAVVSIHAGANDAKTNEFSENTYEAHKLTVTKEVTGNLGDKNADNKFPIKVTFVNETNAAMNSDIKWKVTGSEGADEWTSLTAAEIANGKTFNLAHGEYVEFTNVPKGLSYKVEETNSDIYTVSYDVKDINTKPVAMGSADASVTVTNDLSDDTIDTGISLDNAPYMILMALVVVAGAALIVKRASANR